MVKLTAMMKILLAFIAIYIDNGKFRHSIYTYLYLS